MTTHFKKFWTAISRCPNCGEQGQLFVVFTRNKPEGKLSGPFFRVLHRKVAFDKSEYATQRARGKTWRDMKNQCNHTKNRECFIKTDSKAFERLLEKLADFHGFLNKNLGEMKD